MLSAQFNYRSRYSKIKIYYSPLQKKSIFPFVKYRKQVSKKPYKEYSKKLEQKLETYHDKII